MAQIVAENLVKTFQVAERTPGLWGALRGVVHRRYRTVRALDGISFAIEPGELVGSIGPNAAGKSTTVKVLRDVYRVGETAHRQARDELIAMLALEPVLDVPVRQLSLGQRMRCDLAIAFLGMQWPAFLGWAAPAVGVGFLLLTLGTWRFGVRHYRSTGSWASAQPTASVPPRRAC